MAEADVTEEQLAKSNEPQFKAAITAKQEAKTDAKQAPQAYRQSEQAELSQAQAEAVTTSQEKLQGMHGDRAKLLTQVVGKQTESKGKDEQSRAKVAGDIQQIYSETKTKVESILTGLDTKVETAFDSGAAKAKKAFEDYVDKHMSAYKDKRYSGLVGKGTWLKDKLLGMPSEVNKFYQEGKNLYLNKMDGEIDRVVNVVGNGLSQAKSEVANGKKRVQNYVSQLPANLKSIGQQAALDIQSEFNSLEESVDAKQNELIDKLAQKYQENVQALDARIEEMKAANQGLVDKASNYMTGVIETINKLKEMLVRVLAKAAGVVGKIIKDPIGFLGNLVKGLKQGFDNFAGNIGKHLQAGLIGWLTGAMGAMGIQIPDDIFSLKGIFNLVMQILGLTWDYVRKKAVKLFGARVVAAMEKGSEIFQVLMQGPDGLWKYVQEEFSDLKETVIGAIKEMVITKVIIAGIKWIIGLLNPVGAFIKAAMAIYEIIMFFVNNAARIIDLISAIVDAVGAIARGAIGGAAKLVENALVKALPVVIGFLASLLGVSGLAKKVQAIVKKVRKRIDKAIDKLLMKAKKAVKKLFKGKKGKKDKGKKDKKNEGESVSIPFSMNGSSHTLTLTSGSTGKVLMASNNPGLLSKKIGMAINKLKPNTNKPEVKERITALEKIKDIAIKVEKTLHDSKASADDKKRMKKEGIKLTTAISQYGDKYDMKDITGALELYPPPVVGLYNQILNDKTPPPDGTTREAHHAPPAQLAKSLSVELLNASKTFVKRGIVLTNDPFEKAANNINSAGDNLPAILVHASTHRVKGAGSRIHGSAIRAELTERLKKKGISKEEAITTKQGQVTVNPRDPAYKRYMHKKVKHKLTSGDINAIKLAFLKAYNFAAAQTLSQVSIALKDSNFDGSTKDRKAATRELRKKAKEVWKGQLLKPLN